MKKRVEKLCKEIIMHGQRAYATSRDVAKHFGKRHDHVLRDIENIVNPAPKSGGWIDAEKDTVDHFSALNFERSNYVGEDGKEHPMFEMTRDGFAFLVMGFTGAEASIWKIAYIEAFNRMERRIRADVKRNDDAWREANADRINAEKGKSASVHDFIKYAIGQGSKHAGWYFVNFARLVNAVAIPENPFVGPLLMTAEQSARVSAADTVCCIAIYEGMQQMHYKEIYTYAKETLQAYAMDMGWPVAVLGHDLNQPDELAEAA